MFFSSTGWILPMYNRFSYGYLWFSMVFYPCFFYVFFLCCSILSGHGTPLAFHLCAGFSWRWWSLRWRCRIHVWVPKTLYKPRKRWKSHKYPTEFYGITVINFSILLGVATVHCGQDMSGWKGPRVVPKDRWCAARVRWTGPTGRPGRGHGNGGLVEDCYHPSN